MKEVPDGNIQHNAQRALHLMTQGKIEWYHRSMKTIVLFQNYFVPEELELALAFFVEYYNHERYSAGLEDCDKSYDIKP